MELGYQHNFRQEFSQYVNHGYIPPVYPDTMQIAANLEREFDKQVYSLNLRKGLVPIDGDALFDSEMGLPLLIKNLLPIGFSGIVIAAYFSAVLSTADNCLMAASGSIVGDLIPKHRKNEKTIVLLSRVSTLIIGVIAILLAAAMENVLSLMLYAYAYMVSGLFVPVVGAMILKKRYSLAACSNSGICNNA